MTETLLFSILIASIAAASAGLLILRRVRSVRDSADSEERIMKRLDGLLDSMSRVREESRAAVQDKVAELLRHAEEQDRSAREEIQRTLNGTTEALIGRFEKLQQSNEQKLGEIRGEVEKKLSETLKSSGQAFKDVTDRLSELHVTNQRIVEFSRDLNELQGILKAPKLRGILGEAAMERMLADCLAADQYEFQREIEGNIVDAVIFNPTGHVPIDSKFPLDSWRKIHADDLSDADRNIARRNFVRDVKKHLDDISRKYIRPPETLPFAVMYIPAEGVYYEMMEYAELAEYARAKSVFPASPMTFWALLQVTVIGFRGMRISEEAQHISGLLRALTDDFRKMRDVFDTANKQLGHAKSNMDNAATQLDRFGTKLDSIHGTSLDQSEPLNLPGDSTP
ncbi:MAG: DNA recombination protein RmuC [bacterium]|nr:DNA recombination protein RmuC [bacterium]